MEEYYIAKRTTGDVYLYTEGRCYAVLSVQEFEILTNVVLKENTGYKFPIIRNKYYVVHSGGSYFITNTPCFNYIYLYPHSTITRIPCRLMTNLNLPEAVSGITPLTEEEIENLFKFQINHK